MLVLVAHQLELAGFGGVLASETSPTVSPVIERDGLRVGAAVVGVGLLAAGSGAARALIERPARAAVLLGSFGAFPAAGAPPIGSLLVPTELRAIDDASLRGQAAFPGAMPHAARCDTGLGAGLSAHASGAARAALATVLAITTDDALARTLGERSQCCGENLEAVAVALACAAARVPFAALLACTNEVGSQGRSQWAAEHRHAASATASALLAWLAAGAPGLLRA